MLPGAFKLETTDHARSEQRHGQKGRERTGKEKGRGRESPREREREKRERRREITLDSGQKLTVSRCR